MQPLITIKNIKQRVILIVIENVKSRENMYRVEVKKGLSKYWVTESTTEFKIRKE